MKSLNKLVKVDIMKLKSTQMVPIHVYMPILGLVIFLSYYYFTSWDSYNKISSYLQTICITLPVLISVITSMVSEQEHISGDFRNILTYSGIKFVPLISKFIIFLSLGLFSILISNVGFYIGFSLIDIKIFPLSIYVYSSLILLVSSMFMYNIHFFLSFRFSKSISIGIGILESLIAALFLTGMGDSIWPLFPSSWSSRFISSLIMKYQGASEYVDPLLNKGIIISIIFTIVSFLAIITWFTKWEGKKLEE